MDFVKIANKWQRKWKREKTFEPNIDDKKRKEGFYIQVAYPYPSGAMHIGHARTYTITDIVAKYNMLLGKNVLLPMGWHVSGTPVIASVEALKNGDDKTEEMFTKNFRIPKDDIKKLTTPKGFVRYMVNKAKYGYKVGFGKLGLGVDWRRELTTIDPQYSRFIEWQYGKLNEKGYIQKGDYPIRYCPHDKNPVGDHDLLEGEGVGITEMTLLKFKMDDGRFIVAATLRPETVFGQTNLWVNPKINYIEVKIGKEIWVVSKECADKLKYQKKNIKIGKTVSGRDLIGNYAKAPGANRKIIILPSNFPIATFGTGLVTSVPSDAPYDYIALKELQNNKNLCEKYGLDWAVIKKIEVIKIIKTNKYGDFAAKKVADDMGIDNQTDKRLESATADVYKDGFHNGIMLENCGKYAGMKVSEAKDKMKAELIKKGDAELFFELESPVVCRCRTDCVVSVLDDQWFVTYGDAKWKEEARKTLADMNIVDESFRRQYERVFEWLENKPCTRAKGLGTKFPFDKKKIVEPLGDSTVYMAYFTISHLIKEIDAKKLNKSVFDFIFLNKGTAGSVGKKNRISKKVLEDMKKEFEYWYPLNYNTSALELIPNHMSFSIFQHTAIFPPEKRQLGTLNLGMLVMDGKKMSSSKGNVILINDIVDDVGSDMVRLLLMNFVEPWEEMDWREDDIKTGLNSIKKFINVIENYAKPCKMDWKKLCQIDKWMVNRIHDIHNKYNVSMSNVELRKALQEIVFNLANSIKWYERRAGVNKKVVMGYVVEKWVKMIAPFAPHLAEELWRVKLKNNESVFDSVLDSELAVDKDVDMSEDALKKIVEDVSYIKKLANIDKIKKLYLYKIPNEEYDVEFLKKEFGNVIIFDVNDPKKVDPENKSKKAKPGKPGIYLE